MDISEEEKDLRKALQYDILNIVLQQDATSGMRTTTGAIRALTELVWQYLHNAMIPDLVAFSNHAKNRTISTDDVGLVLRKLPDKLEQFQRKFPTATATAIGGGGGGRSNTSNSGASGMAAAASRSVMNGGRRSLPLSPAATSGKQGRSITTTSSSGTSTVANNARERDREREYQNLLLASSDDDDIDDNETTGHNSKLPSPGKKSGELEVPSDSMSSDDESDDNNDNTRQGQNQRKRTTLERTRHSYPPTTSTKRTSYGQQQTRNVLQDVPMNTATDENDDGQRKSSPRRAAAGTRDDISPKRPLSRTSSSDDDAPIIAPKMRKLQRRQHAIGDDDDDDQIPRHREDSIDNQASPKKPRYEDDLEDSPMSSPAHPTSPCSISRTMPFKPMESKEPVKSQVAEILADLSYDSGPESTDPFGDDTGNPH